MYQEKIKLNIQTNVTVKFITAVSTSLSIKSILPFLTQKYKKVVQENLHEQQYNLDDYREYQIIQISKNDYLIPLDDLVKDILNDNDCIFINLAKRVQKKEFKSKKQILETKIKQKNNKNQKLKESQSEKKKLQKLDQQKTKIVKNNAKDIEQDKQKQKLLDKKVKQIGNKEINFSALLHKIRNDNQNETSKDKKQQVKKAKPQIVEEQSDS